MHSKFYVKLLNSFSFGIPWHQVNVCMNACMYTSIFITLLKSYWMSGNPDKYMKIIEFNQCMVWESASTLSKTMQSQPLCKCNQCTCKPTQIKLIHQLVCLIQRLTCMHQRQRWTPKKQGSRCRPNTEEWLPTVTSGVCRWKRKSKADAWERMFSLSVQEKVWQLIVTSERKQTPQSHSTGNLKKRTEMLTSCKAWKNPTTEFLLIASYVMLWIRVSK